MVSKVLDWVYPPRCPVCHGIVMPKGHLVCVSCMEKVQPIGEPRCKKCGKSISSSAAEYCYDCHHTTHHFDQGLGIFPYNSLWQKSIMQFKYHGRREYRKFYGAVMAVYGAEMIRRWQPQVLIPVPIHRSRLRRRGYNQAAELARELGLRLQIPVDEKLVQRKEHTRPQKELNRKQRKANLQKAFVVKKPVTYARVLLIDDIYTTGSTVDSIAVLLKNHGVQQVWFLSLCVGGGF